MTFNSTELASNSIVAICSNQFDLNSAIGSPPSGLAELGNDNPMQRLCPVVFPPETKVTSSNPERKNSSIKTIDYPLEYFTLLSFNALSSLIF